MQLKNKVYCHWDLIRFIGKDHLVRQEDGADLTLSIIDREKDELMIFLEKNAPDYEVRVYKDSPDNKYIPHKEDKVKHYEENDEYATFFFDTYGKAHDFVDSLPYRHSEYRDRPAQKIKSNTT